MNTDVGSGAVDGVSPDLVELRAKAERHRSSHFVHVDPEAVLWLLDRITEAQERLTETCDVLAQFGMERPSDRVWLASVEEIR